MPMIGQPICMAISMTLQILAACCSPREPPKTVKSWLKTKTFLPSIVPQPVTTPSPKIFLSSRPKLLQRCVTNSSISTNEPGSRSCAMRSRAVPLPLDFCFSTASFPPPVKAFERFSSSSAQSSSIVRNPISDKFLLFILFILEINSAQKFFLIRD